MAEVKRTQITVLGEILELGEIQANAEYKELIEKIIEQKEKKNAYKRETPVQKENAELVDIIRNVLATNGKCTLKDIQVANDRLAVLGSQKMTALITKLVNNGEVVKTIEKKVRYYELVD